MQHLIFQIFLGQEKLAGDILEIGTGIQDIDALMETAAEDKRRIEQVKANKKSVEEALEIVSNISHEGLQSAEPEHF